MLTAKTVAIANYIKSMKNIKNIKNRRVWVSLALLLTLLAAVVLPSAAQAHPLGNFTVNRYSRLEVGAAGVRIYYVIDMAEIPTFQEKDLIDTNHDNQISADEQQNYLNHKIKEIQGNLSLTLAGVATPLKLEQSQLAFLAGQGGLQTMRLTAQFETGPLAATATDLSYQDNNYSDRLGWKEIVLRNADGIALSQSSVAATDQSNELRTYPQDMLSSPLNVTSAQASFKLDPTVHVQQTVTTASSGVIDRAQDPFADLVNGGELTLGVVLVSFLLAFVLGMAHALSPGHGKTVVAAYLVGTRGTARHAIFLGLSVTITHTLGVFALGLLTLFASQFIVPEKLYPWLGVLSGLIVVVMGLTLLRSRLRYAITGIAHPSSTHSHSHVDDHDHDHAHEHEHDHPHIHSHVDDHDHHHTTDTVAASPELVLAIATLDHEYQHAHGLAHSHSHDYNHDSAELQLPHTHHHASTDDHSHDHAHTAASAVHTHSHGGKAHSHLPPELGADGTPLSWKRLLLFGVSAGLLPCPSALVVMLSSIALGRTAFGLVLIVFFSLGLATTLTTMGILLVYARNLFRRVKLNTARSFVRLLPVASAALVAVLGIFISYEALIQTGLWSR
jgi:ABC-type nickel/cobalt efflux system permease component RcnA